MYFEKQSPLSGYYPYTKSDKVISFTLAKKYSEIRIEAAGCVEWCGMDVTLPESYAVEKWYYPSSYDVFLEGDDTSAPLLPEKRKTSTILVCPTFEANACELTVNADISYTTSEILEQSSAETIDHWGEEMKKTAPTYLLRIERAAFNIGTEYASALQYYGDFLNMCDKQGFSWL